MSKNTFYSVLPVVLIIFVIVLMGVLKIWLEPKSRADEAMPSIAISQALSSPVPTDKIDLGQEYTRNSSEPITFSTGDLNVAVSKRDGRAAQMGTYLVEHAHECGPSDRPASYFGDLAHLLAKLPATIYTINSNQRPLKPGTQFSLSVVPNELGYKDLHSAQVDFFHCPADSGVEAPIKFSEHWVVFAASCKPNDDVCQKIANVVIPSVAIKS